MKRWHLPLIAGALLIGAVCRAAAPNAAEGQFIARAVALSQFQIEAAELAQSRASAGDVQAFARQMQAQHRETLRAWQPYIGKTAPAPTGAYAGLLGDLKDARGTAFDQRYLGDAVAGPLGEALPAYEDAMKNGADPAIRDVAKRAAAQLAEQRTRALALRTPASTPAADTVAPTPPGEAPAVSPASRTAPAAGTAGPGGGAPQK